MSLTNDTTAINRPFLLKPAPKDYLWGGSRLNNDFSKGIPMTPLAETWECSTHPDGQSIVSGGRFDGQPLGDVLKTHPEYLGTHPRTQGDLPILIKLIDAESDLSVQVHPDDEYARTHENGAMGKTEMWYVLDAAKDTRLVYGFHRDVTREQLQASISNGSIEKYLQKIPVHRDDVFFIEAGTVHAIGKGALIAEIQQNSDLTYRLYDYNRTDKNGLHRTLHIDKALDTANLRGSAEPRQPIRLLRYKKGCASELLCRCRYFQVERLILNTEAHRQPADYQTGSNSFQVLLCIDGCGVLSGSGISLSFFKGDCIFVPADSIPLEIQGKAQLLNVGC